MFEWLVDPEAWISLLTLAALEIVLGIDNIIFISILVGRLPASQRQSGRIIGLGLAMITRILLLSCFSFLDDEINGATIHFSRSGNFGSLI